jgi:hypothetical protein
VEKKVLAFREYLSGGIEIVKVEILAKPGGRIF